MFIALLHCSTCIFNRRLKFNRSQTELLAPLFSSIFMAVFSISVNKYISHLLLRPKFGVTLDFPFSNAPRNNSLSVLTDHTYSASDLCLTVSCCPLFPPLWWVLHRASRGMLQNQRQVPRPSTENPHPHHRLPIRMKAEVRSGLPAEPMQLVSWPAVTFCFTSLRGSRPGWPPTFPGPTDTAFAFYLCVLLPGRGMICFLPPSVLCSNTTF